MPSRPPKTGCNAIYSGLCRSTMALKKKARKLPQLEWTGKNQLSRSLLVALSLMLLLGPSLLLPAGAKTSAHSAPARIATLSTAAADPISAQDLDDAVKILSDYIKIDTTNPPGNEKLGARYLADILEKNGIEASVIDVPDTRANNRAFVIGRLKGSGAKKAVILLNHIDVVPARAADWKYPPFGGEVHDGELWGRGAMDMKGMGIMELAAMLALKRNGVKLDRDVIFLATPDEEIGGTYGARWIVEHKKDLIADAEYLINEGYPIDAAPGGKAKHWGVDVAEKSILWLSLTAKGVAGHASMPLKDSANNRLIAALARLAASPPKMTLQPAVKTFFRSIAANESSPLKELYANIEESVKDKKNEAALHKDLMKFSMLGNTVSITVLKAGYKTNVIPAESYAELDCRLLPGVTPEQFSAEIKTIIDDPSIEVKTIEWEKSDPSPFDSAMVHAIERANAQESAAPVVPVVPVLVPWFTDSHWFREIGINSYGFEPVECDPEHTATMHGKDERIPVASFKQGIVRMYRILSNLSQM
ncbi:MAG: M20/M25/M40 family metallo-hydrolase [Cyanobacteria bacterium REEB67]|nr:M20/M25/M40 family metallo-hydrolase [Cyanobacteria bacterium REEB67]